jgi:uncharacterized protein (DUF488 family)
VKRPFFSIGHSNQSLDQLTDLLTQHQIGALVDIRLFPGSRKSPYFSRDQLALALPKLGIEYHWIEGLGGRRRSQKAKNSSPNQGLRNQSFRNYADYMLTEEFSQAAQKLLEIANHKQSAMMCAEAVFWRCHRRLVSDFLLANGITVQHIFPNGKIQPHRLTAGAKLEKGRVTYPPTLSFLEEDSLD